MPGKCKFNQMCLRNKEYIDWLAESDASSSAFCRLRKKSFDVANMGESALNSHAKGTKHKELVKAASSSTAGATSITDFWLFKDSPARREDLLQFTGADSFPPQFCSHRWLENVPVAEKGLALWPHIKEFLAAVKSTKIPEPQNKSYRTLEGLTQDPLFEARVQAFLSIARLVTPFLKKFQADAPMLPFLASDLVRLVKSLLERCVKGSVLESANTVAKLASLNLKDKDLFLPINKVDPGFAARNIVKSASKVNERAIFSFHSEVKEFLITVVTKILEKSPLRYGLARNLTWLQPSSLAKGSKSSNQAQLRNCLSIMEGAKRVSQQVCDAIATEYSTFFDESRGKEEFSSFDPNTDRLDSFWHDQLSASPYKKLWKVVSTLLILSHGQASVERGFSENKELMVLNMKEKTLVSLRAVADHLNHVGGIEKVEMTKKLLFAASSSRQAYQHYLNEQKEEKKRAEQGRKRKTVLEDLDNLKKKRQITEESITALEKGADDYAERAEKRFDMKLLSKSNALRKSAKEKKEELERLSDAITAKLHEIDVM